MNAYLCRYFKKMRSIFVGLALSLTGPCFIVPGHAAAYLKIEGIAGEAMAPGHEEWIEIETIQISAERSISYTTGGSRVASRAMVSDMTMIKALDKSSPLLFTEAVLGSPLQIAEIHLTRPVDGQEVVYLEYRLDDVLVSSLSTSGSDFLTESVSLNFQKIEMRYYPIRSDGTRGTPIIATYDVAQDTSS